MYKSFYNYCIYLQTMTKLATPETKISSALLDDTADQESEPKVEQSLPQSKLHPSAQKKLRSYKIIVLGESGVGKTCLSFRFCAGRFPLHSEATIGLDFREKIVEIDGERLKLQLWDTAGQERFRRSITHHYYRFIEFCWMTPINSFSSSRNVDAVIFVYDVNEVGTLMALDSWVEEVEQHGVGVATPRVLVGNKVDQADTGLATTSTAQRWADDRNMPLFETSAKDDTMCDHVDGIFLTIAHKLVSGKSLMKPVPDPAHPETQAVRLVYQSTIAAPPSDQEESCCF